MAFRGKRGLTKRTQKRNKRSAHNLAKALSKTRNYRAKKSILRKLHTKIKYA